MSSNNLFRGVKSLKQTYFIGGVYLLWVLLHVFLFLKAADIGYIDNLYYFYPIFYKDFCDVGVYGVSEFLIYTIMIPLILFYFYKIKGKYKNYIIALTIYIFGFVAISFLDNPSIIKLYIAVFIAAFIFFLMIFLVNALCSLYSLFRKNNNS